MYINLKQNLLTLTLLSCAAGMIGCSQTDTKTAANKGNTTVEKPATTTEKPATTPSTTEKATTPNATDVAATADKIGVPECDEYIEKYQMCLTKNVPEQSRALMKNSFEQTRKSWKDIAGNPQTKATLANVCKQAKDAAKQATSAFHCEW